MGTVFERHPRLAYWPEPRHVWTWGNSYRPDDELEARHATPGIARHIRAQFERFVRERGKERLVEKTPSNCLRLPFIRAIYPHARIVVVTRDGRSVLRSTEEQLDKGVPTGRIIQRARETPLWEWPAYAGRTVMTVGRKLAKKPLNYWGPRPRGWREWVRRDVPDVVLARQWAATILKAVRDARAMDPALTMIYRYEDLMADPRRTMTRIVDFCELGSEGQALIDHVASSVDPKRQEKWRDQLDERTLDLVRPIMEPVLQELGYAW